ncbi:MAG: hypothetical protein HUU47_10405 [Bacteroidetes bacterium]|nr:hypothetical protein [Bacteroidota bacterium]
MKTFKFVFSAIFLLTFLLTKAQTVIENQTDLKNLLKINGITYLDTLNVEYIANLKELTILVPDNIENYKSSDFQILSYDAAIVPKDKPAEFFINVSNQISPTFIEYLKNKTGVVKVLFDNFKVLNKITGEIIKIKICGFCVKI